MDWVLIGISLDKTGNGTRQRVFNRLEKILTLALAAAEDVLIGRE